VLVIDGAAAGILAGLLDQALATRHRLGQATPPAAYELLTAAKAAHAFTALGLPVPHPEPTIDGAGQAGAPWISTDHAARALHIGERAVRKRLAAGTLHGRKWRGQWEVRLDPEQAAHPCTTTSTSATCPAATPS
jgi:hypothetical protein